MGSLIFVDTVFQWIDVDLWFKCTLFNCCLNTVFGDFLIDSFIRKFNLISNAANGLIIFVVVLPFIQLFDFIFETSKCFFKFILPFCLFFVIIRSWCGIFLQDHLKAFTSYFKKRTSLVSGVINQWNQNWF